IRNIQWDRDLRGRHDLDLSSLTKRIPAILPHLMPPHLAGVTAIPNEPIFFVRYSMCDRAKGQQVR
ncbi:MAG TPA: hypothetical protein VJ793_11685, partial [Anaerolineae bacterium]|nr:hypothetical protein [Anaerolineae bacterium]